VGVRDSSRTRVAPVFDRLAAGDATEWLPRLLSLPRREDRGGRLPESLGPVTATAWYGTGAGEKRLVPPTELLRLLIQRPATANPPAGFGTRDPVKREKRRLLFSRDPPTVAEALAAVDRFGFVEREWFVFEGSTSVDAYVETEELILLIEGKRTEAGPTTKTQWMPVRHQMLRNIDDAWNEKGSKTVVGFFIVEGKPPHELDLPRRWERAVRETVSTQTLARSLPHRSPADRTAIARAFLGATTWQCVCDAFGIPWDEIRGLEVKPQARVPTASSAYSRPRRR
jgi:hypothetical protein